MTPIPHPLVSELEFRGPKSRLLTSAPGPSRSHPCPWQLKIPPDEPALQDEG